MVCKGHYPKWLERQCLGASDRERIVSPLRACTNELRSYAAAPQSDLAQQITKDPYNFDFLMIDKDARERDLERGLLSHLRDFLLELGVVFAFVGSQHRIQVGEEEFFVDLLSYDLIKAQMLRGDRSQDECVSARIRWKNEFLLIGHQ